MPYAVCLVDCTDQMTDRSAIQQLLQAWFGRAASYHQPPITPVTVTWNNTPAAGTDLVIHFVQDFRHSVVRRMRGFTAPRGWRSAGGLTGLTNPEGNYRPGDLHVSEVYLNKWDTPAGLAMAAFHEAMHNQLRVGPVMHAEPRNYGAGVAVEFPPPGTTPTEDNLRRVGQVMDLQHTQMLNGYSLSRLSVAPTPQRRR